MRKFRLSFLIFTFISSVLFALNAQAYDGRIIDAQTKAPIAGAIVVLGDEVVTARSNGTFHLNGTGDTIKVHTPGYQRQEVASASLVDHSDIPMTPFKVKALYLTGYGLADHGIRNKVLQAVDDNNFNALVIDMKGDRGFIPFKVNIPLADQIGAQKTILIKDAPALMAALKQKHLYLIARIVVFKDDLLAQAKPEWAVKKDGAIFHDRENLRWIDPFQQQAWDYNIAIAKAAAEMGFDEVQFDYVRFPDTRGVEFSQATNQASRTQAITGFLTAAHKALAPYNVMVSADIFGYVPWNSNDTDIGQDINQLVNAVDIVSPMLYPSGFQLGIPKHPNPVQAPYETVNLTLQRAIARTKVSALHFRPWLQAFHDYAFKGGDFSEDRMRIQIKAANDAGASGYMFWNPRNVYPTGKFDS